MCDDANEVLSQYGLTATLVDIDSSESLRDQFDTCVPVVEIDGKIRFRGKVEPVLLRRLLTNSQRGA